MMSYMYLNPVEPIVATLAAASNDVISIREYKIEVGFNGLNYLKCLAKRLRDTLNISWAIQVFQDTP